MIITFCGHSLFFETEEYRQKLLAFLEEKIGEKQADFYLGGYGKFDDFAYRCCKEYKKKHPNVTLFYITPYMTIEYQKNHLENLRTLYDGIIYPEIEDKPLKFAISYRNKWMVEKADFVVAYICRDSGGAYATYKHAKRKGKPIFNLVEFE